jgi:hypothetical protein
LDPDLGFGSGLFLKNTLKFTLFFLLAQRILHRYLNCRSSKLRKKLIFKNLYISTALCLLVGNRS